MCPKGRSRRGSPIGHRSRAYTNDIASALSRICLSSDRAFSKTRSPALPDVATAMEQGFDVKAYTWNGFFLPKGTPPAIVEKLNHAMVEAMKTPAIREKLEASGLRLVSGDRTTPAYLDRFVQDEIAKWAVLIKASGISID
jgi:tripartite-type tricarboxylate transporter receptor subunit TctC